MIPPKFYRSVGIRTVCYDTNLALIEGKEWTLTHRSSLYLFLTGNQWDLGWEIATRAKG